MADEATSEAIFPFRGRDSGLPLPRDWEPWFRLIGQLHAHRSWNTFTEALGRGLEALTGARSVVLIFGDGEDEPVGEALVGPLMPLPTNPPQEPGEVLQEQLLTTVMLFSGQSGSIWLLLQDPGRVDLEYCLPVVAPTIGLAIQRVRAFAATRARASERLSAPSLALYKMGASRQSLVASSLEALEYAAAGRLAVMITDDGNGRLEAHARHDGEIRTGLVDDAAVQDALREGFEQRTAVGLRGQLARSLALSLRRGDAPTGFYYFLPVPGSGTVDYLVGLGLPDARLEEPGFVAMHDLAGFPRVSRKTLAQLDLVSQVKVLARDISGVLANGLAAERGFVEGMTRESSHLGMDLHDSVLQDVAYVQLQLGRLEQELPEEVLTARTIVHEIHGAVSTLARELRELSIGLTTSRPNADLIEAITPLVDRFRSRFDGDVRLRVRGTKRRLSPTVSGQTARIAQELLNNIWKHADATRANVEVSYAADHLELLVQDDGRGFAPTSRSTSQLGLRGIEQRIDELGGTVSIDTEPDKGTAIRVRIPT